MKKYCDPLSVIAKTNKKEPKPKIAHSFEGMANYRKTNYHQNLKLANWSIWNLIHLETRKTGIYNQNKYVPNGIQTGKFVSLFGRKLHLLEMSKTK